MLLCIIYVHLSHCFSLLRRLPLEHLANRNFWKDICRAKNRHVYFYASSNTAAYKASFLENLEDFIGPANDAMNKAIASMCKQYPLNLIAFSKTHMLKHGAGELFNLKERMLMCMAENIIRYIFVVCQYIFYYLT